MSSGCRRTGKRRTSKRIEHAAPPQRTSGWLVRDLDLVLVSLASLVALVAMTLELPLEVRLPLGLAMTVFLPGYAASMALFPPGQLRGVERSALAFTLSLAVVVAAAPFLNAAPSGIAPLPLVAVVTAATLVATAAAWLRRRDVRRRNNGAADAATDDPTRSRVTRGRMVAAGLGVIGVMILASFVDDVAAPRAAPTEFFIVVPDGNPSAVPDRVMAGRPTSISFGITNREPTPQQFSVVLVSGSTELSRTGPITVASGATWLGTATVVLLSPGNDQVIRLLLHAGPAADVFRSLSLELDVVPPP